MESSRVLGSRQGSRGWTNRALPTFIWATYPKPASGFVLEVDAESVGLKPESQLNGWAFTQFGGTVHWDKAGTVAVAPLADEKLASLHLWEQFRKKVKSPPLPGEIQKILDAEQDKRSEDQVETTDSLLSAAHQSPASSAIR